MLDLNEFQTRKIKIDVLLEKQGWNVEQNQNINDRSKIFLEIDTRSLILKNRITSRFMKPAETMLRVSMRIICCWTVTGRPLVIIKRTLRDSLSEQKQVKEYADDIKAQTGQVFSYFSPKDTKSDSEVDLRRKKPCKSLPPRNRSPHQNVCQNPSHYPENQK